MKTYFTKQVAHRTIRRTLPIVEEFACQYCFIERKRNSMFKRKMSLDRHCPDYCLTFETGADPPPPPHLFSLYNIFNRKESANILFNCYHHDGRCFCFISRTLFLLRRKRFLDNTPKAACTPVTPSIPKEYRSRIHERKISLRILGIILKALQT
jgi:hypothetical protein